MQNFNLANYYDKTLVDIHKQYIDSTSDVDEVLAQGTKKKPIVIFLSFVLMFASAFATAYYLHVNRIVPPTERIPSIADRKSNEENRGYVRVQVFEFDNESTVTNLAMKDSKIERKDAFDNIVDFTPQREDVYRVKVKDIYAMDDTAKGVLPTGAIGNEPTDKNEAYPISSYKKSGDEMIKNILKEEMSPKKSKPVQVASAGSMVSMNDTPSRYSIQFDNVSQADYVTLRNLGSVNRLIATVSSSQIMTPKWTIYQEDSNSSKVINGFKVTIIQSFDSNSDALEHIEYLKVSGGNFILHVEDIITEIYNVKLCCTDIDKAKSIAIESKVTDSVIRIVREP